MQDCWSYAVEGDMPDDVVFTIVLTPTPRRGVWKVVAREHYTAGGKAWGLRRQHVIEFPGPRAATLAGALFTAVTGCGAELVQEKIPGV